VATLTSILGVLALGQHVLQVNLLGWRNAGSCKITVNQDFEFAASGSYSVMGRSGTFDISLKLTDEDPSAVSGACSITNGGQTLAGKYTKTGSVLTFSAKQHSITASTDSGNVILQLSGYPKARIVA
jgi:hypothetical protein